MMKAHQMQGVEQITTHRAVNHLPPVMGLPISAQVAPIKSSQPSRRHTCHQLGICQCEGLNCIETEPEPIPTPHGDTLYWGVVIFVSTLTCGVVGGVAGVLYSTFGG